VAEPTRLSVAVITPGATVFEGEADLVVVPAWDGEVGFLRDHAPMMALLGDRRDARDAGRGENGISMWRAGSSRSPTTWSVS
jgi:hypothetical protein